MPRPLRVRLPAEFRVLIFADPRGIVRLSVLAGWPYYTRLSELLHASYFAGTAVKLSRLQKLAELIGYDGPVVQS